MKTEMARRETLILSGVVDVSMMNICCENQHSMMLGSIVITPNALRIPDDKSVPTGRTRRVGGDVVVGEGGG